MCQKALDLERRNGKERTESKCRKDEDHDLRYGPGPLAEFSSFFLHSLSIHPKSVLNGVYTFDEIV